MKRRLENWTVMAATPANKKTVVAWIRGRKRSK